MRQKGIPFFIMLGVVMAGCGTGGNLVTPEQVARLSIGTTTQQQVRNQLGEPKEKIISYENEKKVSTWIYYLTRFTSDPQTGVPPIGITQVPISRAHRKTTEVAIFFDQNKVVTDIQKYISNGNN